MMATIEAETINEAAPLTRTGNTQLCKLPELFDPLKGRHFKS